MNDPIYVYTDASGLGGWAFRSSHGITGSGLSEKLYSGNMFFLELLPVIEALKVIQQDNLIFVIDHQCVMHGINGHRSNISKSCGELFDTTSSWAEYDKVRNDRRITAIDVRLLNGSHKKMHKWCHDRSTEMSKNKQSTFYKINIQFDATLLPQDCQIFFENFAKEVEAKGGKLILEQNDE